ncbi:unnamed protein product [Caenorhabditis angaria]|uniref:Uncharacterized protein n=1 Tax=Caenorhabditis angaria TaxID=860376 RepID=A0A9P1I7F0_9PELO|nr:unnamed protein product [Caenorhabditis angaria]
MTTPVSTTSKTNVEPTQNTKVPSKFKKSFMISIVVIGLLLVSIAGIVFALIFSQSKIDENGEKQMIIDHKSKTTGSVTKAIKAVQTFPEIAKNVKFDDLPSDLSNFVYEKIDFESLKNIRTKWKDSDYKAYEAMFEAIEKCNVSTDLKTEKSDFLELLNNPIELHKNAIKKIKKPIDEAISIFNDTVIKEASKIGRLSKGNIGLYSNNMTNMLKNHKISIETKDESYIKSYDDRINSRNSTELQYLIFAIVVLAICFLLFIIITCSFICFQLDKLSPKAFDRILKIIMTITSLIIIGLIIFAILASIGISLFSFDCSLKSDYDIPDSKYYNFDGEMFNIKTITSDCTKQQTLFSKISPFLNAKKIAKYLDISKSNGESISNILQNIDISFDDDGSILKFKYILESQQHNLERNRKCMEKERSYVNFNDYFNELKMRKEDLKNLLENAPIVLNKLKNVKADVDDFIHSTFESFKISDFSCHQQLPNGLCHQLDKNLYKMIICNWIIISGYVVILVFNIMIRCFANIRKDANRAEILQNNLNQLDNDIVTNAEKLENCNKEKEIAKKKANAKTWERVNTLGRK